MAKFLTTVGSNSSIEEIIRTAEKNITIITPFIQLSNTYIERLKEASDTGQIITVITRVKKLYVFDKSILMAIPGVELYDCPNLHAKCYANETTVAITSLNLYEFSERNNREMGIAITKSVDPDVYAAIFKEIASIKRSSLLIKAALIIDETAQECKNDIYWKGKNIDIPSGQQVIAEPGFKEPYNQHLPTLREVITKTYVGVLPALGNRLFIDHFPAPGVSLSVEGYISFDFPSDNFKNLLRERFETRIESEMPELRCFWKRSNLNVYPLGCEIQGTDEASILQKTEGYLRTINYMSDLIIRAMN